MNKKALLALIPLVATLSMLVTPVFAQDEIQNQVIVANGWACVSTCKCHVSGCATLCLFVTEGAPVDPPTITYYVKLEVQGKIFWWTLTKWKHDNNALTVCAQPTCPWSAPALITVVAYLKAPYCVSAFGCGVTFVGKSSIFS